MAESGALVSGLEGIVAVNSQLCDLDGEHGRLAYRGYDISDLTKHATFEEVAHLLWLGELPDRRSLDVLRQEMGAARRLPEAVTASFRLLPARSEPGRALQAGVALLGLFDPEADDNSPAANRHKAVRITSQLATAIATHWRLSQGLEPVTPADELGHAENFLYMLTGERPRAAAARAMNVCLVLYAEHELTASTFTARIIGATLSDMHSAVSGAMGALRGSQHGGALEGVMRLLFEIEHPDAVEDFIDRASSQKRRIMGFGHRVYRAGDPRAVLLREIAEQVCRESPQPQWFEVAKRLHAKVAATKKLIPNADLYASPMLYALGVAPELFTAVVAASRVVGWTANLLEQYANNRLIRPRARYQGPPARPFTALESR